MSDALQHETVASSVSSNHGTIDLHPVRGAIWECAGEEIGVDKGLHKVKDASAIRPKPSTLQAPSSKQGLGAELRRCAEFLRGRL